MADNGYHGLHKKLVDRFGTRGEALWTFVACSLTLVISGFVARVLAEHQAPS